MLLHVPVSLDGLLSLLSGCFLQPTFQTFRAMVLGQISQTGLRSVTGMLVGSRLSGSWHHSRAHRFFGNAVWSPDELGVRVAAAIVARFCEPDAAILVAVDDTLLHRRPPDPRLFLASRRDRQQRAGRRRVGQQLGRRRDRR